MFNEYEQEVTLMIILLVRHGPAQKRGTIENDDDRRLTDSGRQKFSKAALGLNFMISETFKSKNAKTIVVSSPLIRAVETAEIIQKSLGIKDIIIDNALIDGKSDEITGIINSKESDFLILVGHEPWLGEFSKQLCDCRLPFKKGAAAAFSLDNTSEGDFNVNLIWFLQPSVLRKISDSK